MKKMSTVLLVLLLAIAIVVTGCGNTSGNANGNTKGNAEKNNATATPEQPKEEVTLNFTVLPDDEEAFKLAYEEFQKVYPHIKVNFATIPIKQYIEKLKLQLISGEDIDVFAGNLEDYIDTGILQDLDAQIKSNNVDIAGYGPLFEGMKINGKSYGLPYRKSVWMLYYNKNLFDQNNVPYPSADMTWDEFRALAKSMTSGEGENKQYGAFIQHWVQSIQMMAVQQGHTVIDTDLTPFQKALEFRKALEEDGSIMSWAESKSTSAHYNAAFQKGNIAMNIIGDWHVAQLRKAEEEGSLSFDWDVAPLPHPEGVTPNTSFGTPTSLMINQRSKHQDEAFAFIQFMVTEPGAKVFASKGYMTGYVNDEVKEIYLATSTDKKPEHLNYFLEAKVYPEYPIIKGIRSVIFPIFDQEGELYLVSEQSSEETIKKITERIKKEWADRQ
ncbi:sugar ABC transporter substrate-binding protein [Paenibacillus sp. PL2-23]|uniref:ABC transporter substrate-binding protein n=1 Tax=Paenibacillus sp. PL2-23 TaxID=2100729 RepID=UPI0030FA598E